VRMALGDFTRHSLNKDPCNYIKVALIRGLCHGICINFASRNMEVFIIVSRILCTR
jgi:hypothetical protein